MGAEVMERFLLGLGLLQVAACFPSVGQGCLGQQQGSWWEESEGFACFPEVQRSEDPNSTSAWKWQQQRRAALGQPWRGAVERSSKAGQCGAQDRGQDQKELRDAELQEGAMGAVSKAAQGFFHGAKDCILARSRTQCRGGADSTGAESRCGQATAESGEWPEAGDPQISRSCGHSGRHGCLEKPPPGRVPYGRRSRRSLVAGCTFCLDKWWQSRLPCYSGETAGLVEQAFTDDPFHIAFNAEKEFNGFAAYDAKGQDKGTHQSGGTARGCGCGYQWCWTWYSTSCTTSALWLSACGWNSTRSISWIAPACGAHEAEHYESALTGQHPHHPAETTSRGKPDSRRSGIWTFSPQGGYEAVSQAHRRQLKQSGATRPDRGQACRSYEAASRGGRVQDGAVCHPQRRLRRGREWQDFGSWNDGVVYNCGCSLRCGWMTVVMGTTAFCYDATDSISGASSATQSAFDYTSSACRRHVSYDGDYSMLESNHAGKMWVFSLLHDGRNPFSACRRQDAGATLAICWGEQKPICMWQVRCGKCFQSLPCCALVLMMYYVLPTLCWHCDKGCAPTNAGIFSACRRLDGVFDGNGFRMGGVLPVLRSTGTKCFTTLAAWDEGFWSGLQTQVLPFTG